MGKSEIPFSHFEVLETRPQEEDKEKEIFNGQLNVAAVELSRPETIQAGPVYEIRTSNGERLAVDLYFFTDPRKSESGFIRNYILTAVDADNQFVGVRQGSLHREGKQLEFSGRIDTVKGRGIATALDTVLLDVLKRESSKYSEGITWVITNQNLRDLPEREDQEKALEEQARWQALYGPEGRFQTEKYSSDNLIYLKKITAEKKLKPIESLGAIELVRVRDEAYGKVITETPNEELDAEKKERINNAIMNIRKQTDETHLP